MRRRLLLLFVQRVIPLLVLCGISFRLGQAYPAAATRPALPPAPAAMPASGLDKSGVWGEPEDVPNIQTVRGAIEGLEVSPDGTRAAFILRDPWRLCLLDARPKEGYLRSDERGILLWTGDPGEQERRILRTAQP